MRLAVESEPVVRSLQQQKRISAHDANKLLECAAGKRVSRPMEGVESSKLLHRIADEIRKIRLNEEKRKKPLIVREFHELNRLSRVARRPGGLIGQRVDHAPQ